MAGTPVRTVAVLAVILLAMTANPPAALAITPPMVDPTMVPDDGPPGPEQPMRQTGRCRTAIASPQPDITLPAPGHAMLNITQAWRHSTGNGVRVAVIDSGVNPDPRLPLLGGGDYVQGGDGLQDCDLHGTVVASIIAAAPQGLPMPPPMPPSGSRLPANHGPAPDVTAGPAATTRPGDAPVPPDAPAGSIAISPAPDGVVGVAPHATVIAIRQSSDLFAPVTHSVDDAGSRERAGTVSTLARSIVHAANLGASVINVSVTACLSATDPIDQRALGGAVWYAAIVKDSVVVAAAGNEGQDGCLQNPAFDPLNTKDPRDWRQVKTVSAPSWFSDFVLSVGAVDTTGAPIRASLAGPWVGVAAPGVGIVGLAGARRGAVNGYAPTRPGESSVPFSGTSFSAAYVSGVAALVRAKYPELSAHQVIHRIQQTAHNPARGVDNLVGFGLVDPVAALTFDVPAGDRVAPGAQSRILTPPPAPPSPDHRARTVALLLAGTVAMIALLAAVTTRGRRAR
ncbi:MAG: type VII secretion-associated serine protease mycosin [Mycobacterium sp.]|nr:type VII secretion-associated serine protease mycosin [Mycobacterium sp.]